jgi:hypothetical protein
MQAKAKPKTNPQTKTSNSWISLTALTAASLFALNGCLFGNDGPGSNSGQSKGSTKVLTQMVRLEPAAQAHPLQDHVSKITRLSLAKTAADTGATGPHWSSAFHLTSFKTPVTRIVLEDLTGGNFAEIYTCRTGNCLLELVGGELEDILGAVSSDIRPGTYTSVNFNYCQDGQTGYEALVTGDVELNGETWYTQAGTTLTRESPASAATIRYSGCGRSFPLPRPLVIAADSGRREGEGGLPKTAADGLTPEPLLFRLFYDLEGIVWAGLNESATKWAWAPGNCSGPHPDESMTDTVPFLCAGYADVAGTSDTVAPTLERYYLNGSSLFGLFFNSDDTFIGGYSRRYLMHGSSRVPGFEPVTPIRIFEALGGGVYRLGNYGSSLTTSYFETSDFRRAEHNGRFTGERDASGEYEASLTAPH